jgi:hypothetical protein
MNLKPAGPIIDELSRMAQRANHMNGHGKPESTKGSKNLVFKKACIFSWNFSITPQVFISRPKLVQLGAMLGLYY